MNIFTLLSPECNSALSDWLGLTQEYSQEMSLFVQGRLFHFNLFFLKTAWEKTCKKPKQKAVISRVLVASHQLKRYLSIQIMVSAFESVFEGVHFHA